MIKLMVHPEDMNEGFRVQKAAFAAGYKWGSGSQDVDYTRYYWLTFRPESRILKYAIHENFPSASEFTKKSVADILRMLGISQDIDCTIPEDS